MNINIQQLIEQGEGISVEFKKAENKLPETLFETICAFLNRNGGIVLLGVNDDKTIEGIKADVVGSLVKNLAMRALLWPHCYCLAKRKLFKAQYHITKLMPCCVEKIYIDTMTGRIYVAT